MNQRQGRGTSPMPFLKNRVAPASRATPDNMCVCDHHRLHPRNPQIMPTHVTIQSWSGRCMVTSCPCVHDPDGYTIHEDPI